MNINLTLVLQSIAMMIFVWFSMKFIWPPLTKALEERRAKIAEGLAASDRAEQELERAKVEADKIVKEARQQAAGILDQAGQRGNQIIEQAKQDAVSERERQVRATEAEIMQAQNQARSALQKEAVDLSVAAAGKVLGREVKAADHEKLLAELIA